jgi:hypothetical protein
MSKSFLMNPHFQSSGFVVWVAISTIMNFFGNSFAANGLQIRELTQIQVLNLTETRQQINYNSEKTGLGGGKERLNV